jgi:hypothetical protein
MQRYKLEPSDIKKTHKMVLESQLPKISIARNPFEAISSMMAMTIEFFPERNILDIFKENRDDYIAFYKYLLRRFDGIIFSYDALLSVPNTVMFHIENEIGLNRKNNNFLTATATADRKENRHVISSKNLQSMEISKKFLEKEDLSECFWLYKQVLNKVII